MKRTLHIGALLGSLGLFFAVALDACTKQTDAVAPALTTPVVSATTVALAMPASSDSLGQTQVALGRMLFWDPILSGSKDVACATCHHPNNAYTDGLDLSLGEHAVGYGTTRRFILPNDVPFAKRNSQTILNTAFNGMDVNGQVNTALAPMFWDSRTVTLELQATGPLTTLEEMRGHAYTEGLALDSLVARLMAIPVYQQLFQQVYGSQRPVTATNIGKTLAAFERTLIAMNSPYDRYQKGDKTAMTAQQIQGMQAFTAQGCTNCHNGPMFSDFQAHVLGVADNAKLAASDAGVNGTYAFRTPSLRNVALTAPYMHNGVLASLNQVLNFYDSFDHGSQNPHVPSRQLDSKLPLRGVNNNAQSQIIAFLNALTDTSFDRTIPRTVPSKLNSGGSIQ